MTWSKFDDAAPKSPKAVTAGNEAWALWAAAIMYCNRHLTDGYVSLAALATDCLPVPLTPARAKKLADLLCGCRVRPGGVGLFEPAGDGLYLVHDFLEWNPSKAEVDSKRKADRERKRTRGGAQQDSERNPSGTPSESERNPDGIRLDSETPRASARALPDPPVPSRPEREDPPTPKPKPADPMGDQLRGKAPHLRPDVLRVHAAWQTRFGLTGHKFRGFGDLDAAAVAEAIDLHGEPLCLRVLEFAPKDGMVSGRDDEKRVKHDSLRYIFGNAQAFARILRAADEAAPPNGESTVTRIHRLRDQDPGAA